MPKRIEPEIPCLCCGKKECLRFPLLEDGEPVKEVMWCECCGTLIRKSEDGRFDGLIPSLSSGIINCLREPPKAPGAAQEEDSSQE
jgi:hypothetical protein